MANRQSEDIDLFAPERGSPDEVADDLIAKYASLGFTVKVLVRTRDLVQLEATDHDGGICKVDLGVSWRARQPVQLDVGPALHPDDAVAGKMDALFNRWAPRDFLDVDSILRSGRYTRQQLLSIAAEHNPGFSTSMFAESLSYLRRIPDREFIAYGGAAGQIEEMRHNLGDWEEQLSRGV